jgi:endo-alpha-1,4-polygalactosaminidase (GH114 family)
MATTAPRRRWSKEAVRRSLIAWAELYGEAPRTKDWGPHRDRTWPSTETVKYYYPSWNAALEDAGLQTRSRGAPGHLIQPVPRDEYGRILPTTRRH